MLLVNIVQDVTSLFGMVLSLVSIALAIRVRLNLLIEKIKCILKSFSKAIKNLCIMSKRLLSDGRLENVDVPKDDQMKF